MAAQKVERAAQGLRRIVLALRLDRLGGTVGVDALGAGKKADHHVAERIVHGCIELIAQ